MRFVCSKNELSEAISNVSRAVPQKSSTIQALEGIKVSVSQNRLELTGYNMEMGPMPVTQAQIEAMSMIVALFAKYGGVPIECCITHCEAAYFDGYGPYSGDPETRWDLWYLPDYDGVMKGGGDVIRGKARWYLQQAA